MHIPLYIRFLVKRNRREFAFAAKFILFFLMGQGVYLLARPSLAPLLTGKLTAGVGTYFINLLAPGERATAHNSVISGTVSMNIVIGCDGVEGIILVLSALGAFPMPVRRKWAGIVAGTVVIYLANILRVVALYFTLKLYPDAFSFAHMYAGQAFIIMVGFLFFLGWAGRFASNYETAH